MASSDAKRNSEEPTAGRDDVATTTFSTGAGARNDTTTTESFDEMTPQLPSTSPLPMNRNIKTTIAASINVTVAVSAQQQGANDQLSSHHHQLPVVLRDARFRAGRTLVQSGRAAEGATELFATLLEEARNKYGEAHIETAAAYYEYGNAIFRSLLATIDATEDVNAGNGEVSAAESNKKDAGNKTMNDVKMTSKPVFNGVKQKSNDVVEEMDDEEEVDDDVQLSLEMMETAWSILDEYVTTATAGNQRLPASGADYTEWAVEEIPRVLVGIGDVLSHLTRHADAADALSRALPYREQALQKLLDKHRSQQQSKSSRVITNDDDGLPKELISFEHLKCRRQLAEVNVLVAEELLACPPDQDVVTSESNDVLVTAAERVDFAGGYYDTARDELHETVYLLGKLSARVLGSNSGPKLAEFAKAKEDVCFLATLVMGVGESLSVLDEAKARTEAAKQNMQQPPNKKQKI